MSMVLAFPLYSRYTDKIQCPADKCRQWFADETALRRHWGSVHQGSLAKETRECARPDCEETFKTYARNDIAYCSVTCAHAPAASETTDETETDAE